jgi:hypothetical protein
MEVKATIRSRPDAGSQDIDKVRTKIRSRPDTETLDTGKVRTGDMAPAF